MTDRCTCGKHKPKPKESLTSNKLHKRRRSRTGVDYVECPSEREEYSVYEQNRRAQPCRSEGYSIWPEVPYEEPLNMSPGVFG